MSRTYRRDDVKGQKVRGGQYHSHYYRKECKQVRTRGLREVRRDTKRALDNEDYENLPTYHRTSGWETW